MNYRTLAKGALALSLGFVVASASASTTTYTDTPLYGATFESTTSAVEPLNDHAYAPDTLVTTYTDTEGGATYGWLAGTTDESKIIEANGGQALQLNTDSGTLTNKLAPTAVATPFNAGIAAAGAYIETEAKFVASDTLDPGIRGGTDDSKFAIYAYCDEDAGGPTNLVVYHKYMANGVPGYTNEIFGAVNCDVYTKLRVEMKQIDDPTTFEPVNVFSVKVGDGPALTSPLAIDGCWFLTVEYANESANMRVSTINFKGTGEVDNLEVGTFTTSTTYAIDWSASQNVIASNLTDTVQLAAGETNFANAVQLAFYPTEGNVITNVLLNGGEIDGVVYPLDSYTYTVNEADATLTILAGTQAAPATVISVATVGNATVTDNQDGTYTISVPLGNGLSSVYVNGAAVDPSLLTEGQGGTYTLDLSAASGNVNVVVATKKVRTPIGHKWYENPGVIATTAVGKGGQAGPYKFSVGSDFAAISYGNHTAAGTGFKLFTVDDLLIGDATPIYTETRADAQSLNINSIRGAAISEALDVALLTAYDGGKAYSVPLSANAIQPGVNAFEITNDRGITFDRAYFSDDNQYLYTTEVAGGTNSKIAKWAISDGLKGSGQKLTFVTDYAMGSRVRDFAYAKINGKELLYVLQDGTAGVKVYDIAAGTSAQLTAAFIDAANYGSVAISMASTSTPTLTVLPAKDERNGLTPDPLAVYQLAADGLSISSTLATFSRDDLIAAGITAGEYIRTAMPSEDDETLYLGYGNSNLYVLQYTEPQYTAVYTGSENVIVTNTYDGSSYEWGEGEEVVPTEIACLTGTVLSFYPTEGNVITNVTIGGVEQTGFDPACYTITVISDTNLVVLAGATARTKPAWAEQADTTKFWAWVDANGVADYANTDYTAQYLFNADEEETIINLRIVSIEVGANATTIVVSGQVGRGIAKLNEINGVLSVATGSSLSTLTPKAISNVTYAENGDATITIPAGNGSFFRARVDFAAPSTPLVTAE